MKKLILLALAVITFMTLTGCENYIARNYGGTTTVNIETNKKLVNVTWKGDSLWVLTRAMKDGEIAEKYEFKEDSNLGVLNGTVILVESVKEDIK